MLVDVSFFIGEEFLEVLFVRSNSSSKQIFITLHFIHIMINHQNRDLVCRRTHNSFLSDKFQGRQLANVNIGTFISLMLSYCFGHSIEEG